MHALPWILLYTCSVPKLVECFIRPRAIVRNITRFGRLAVSVGSSSWRAAPMCPEWSKLLGICIGNTRWMCSYTTCITLHNLAVCIQFGFGFIGIKRTWIWIGCNVHNVVTMSLWFSFPELEPLTRSFQDDKFPRSASVFFCTCFCNLCCQVFDFDCLLSKFCPWLSPPFRIWVHAYQLFQAQFFLSPICKGGFSMSRPLNRNDGNEWHCQAWQRLTGLELPLYLVETRRKHSACHLVHARHTALFCLLQPLRRQQLRRMDPFLGGFRTSKIYALQPMPKNSWLHFWSEGLMSNALWQSLELLTGC